MSASPAAKKTPTKNPRKAKPKRKATKKPEEKLVLTRETNGSKNPRLVLNGLETAASAIFRLKLRIKKLIIDLKEREEALLPTVEMQRAKAEKIDRKAWPTCIVRGDGDQAIQVIWQHKFKSIDTGDKPKLKKALDKRYKTFVGTALKLTPSHDLTTAKLKKILDDKWAAFKEAVDVDESLVVAGDFQQKRALLRGDLDKEAGKAVDELAKLQHKPQFKSK